MLTHQVSWEKISSTKLSKQVERSAGHLSEQQPSWAPYSKLLGSLQEGRNFYFTFPLVWILNNISMLTFTRQASSSSGDCGATSERTLHFCKAGILLHYHVLGWWVGFLSQWLLVPQWCVTSPAGVLTMPLTSFALQSPLPEGFIPQLQR